MSEHYSNFSFNQKKTQFKIRDSSPLRWSLLFLVIFKLVLVSNEEIIARMMPHDDAWHINAADRLLSSFGYNWDSLLHLPIYPIFIHLLYLIGLPLRFGTELVYCAACCCLCFSLWRLGCGFFLCFFSGIATILQPASFQIPNFVGAEVLLSSLMMFAVAGSLNWWSMRQLKPRLSCVITTSICWALAWNVRKEAIILLAPLGMLALCLVLVDRRNGLCVVSKRLAIGVGIPLCVCFIMATLIAGLNYCRWGLYSSSILSSPGYKAAYKGLQSVTPDKPLRFIGVPLEVRSKVYEVSPHFAQLRPYLEGDIGKNWARISKTSFTDKIGMNGISPLEIASGWFYWALHDAVVASGNGNTPTAENSFLLQVAHEIRMAQKNGLLKQRWVPVTMIEPDWRLWISELPASLVKISRLMTRPTITTGQVYDDPNAAAISWKFDKMATRRAFFTHPQEAFISGWLLYPNEQIPVLSLLSSSGVVATVTPSSLRHDIDRVKPTGFTIRFPLDDPRIMADGLLRIFSEGMGRVDVAMKDIQLGKIFSPDSGTNGKFTLGIDLIEIQPAKEVWMRHFQSLWEQAYFLVVSWIAWSVVAACFLLLWLVLSKYSLPSYTIAFVLFTTITVSRIALFALLDATSWPGDQPRYLFPVMPLFGVMLVTASFIVIETVKVIMQKLISGKGLINEKI